MLFLASRLAHQEARVLQSRDQELHEHDNREEDAQPAPACGLLPLPAAAGRLCALRAGSCRTRRPCCRLDFRAALPCCRLDSAFRRRPCVLCAAKPSCRLDFRAALRAEFCPRRQLSSAIPTEICHLTFLIRSVRTDPSSLTA